MSIRPPLRSDLAAISLVLDDTELFPADLLGHIIEPFFEDPQHSERWFVCEDAELGVVGFGYYRPEPLTEGTWNLIAIAVRSQLQGRGIGAEMLRHVEKALVDQRLLIIETSSLDNYEKSRRLYEKCGYDLVATIPGYWAEGDDKVIFSKTLS